MDNIKIQSLTKRGSAPLANTPLAQSPLNTHSSDNGYWLVRQLTVFAMSICFCARHNAVGLANSAARPPAIYHYSDQTYGGGILIRTYLRFYHINIDGLFDALCFIILEPRDGLNWELFLKIIEWVLKLKLT